MFKLDHHMLATRTGDINLFETEFQTVANFEHPFPLYMFENVVFVFRMLDECHVPISVSYTPRVGLGGAQPPTSM